MFVGYYGLNLVLHFVRAGIWRNRMNFLPRSTDQCLMNCINFRFFFFFGNILLTLSGLKKSSEKLVIVNLHVVTELLSYGAVIFMQLVFIYSFSWNIMFYDDFQVEEEMLMRKFYELMTAHGLTKKVCLHCVERLGTNLSLVSFLNYFLISRPGGFACSLLDLS